MTLKELCVAYSIDARLLKQYFQAFSNLYGVCSLQKAMQIINRQNPNHKITKEQILGFADNYNGNWKIIAPDEVYSNVPTTTPMHHEIVNNTLVYYNDYGGYDYIRSLQGDKDYYIPSKDELLKYAQKEYYEETPHTVAMVKLLKDTLHILDWQRKMFEIMLDIRLDNLDLQDFIDTLGQEFPSFDISQDAITCYTNLHNNTRLMSNRGYTPSELFRRYNPQGALPKSISFGPGIQKLIQSGEWNAEELMKGFAAMSIPQDLRNSLLSEIEKANQVLTRRDESSGK